MQSHAGHYPSLRGGHARQLEPAAVPVGTRRAPRDRRLDWQQCAIATDYPDSTLDHFLCKDLEIVGKPRLSKSVELSDHRMIWLKIRPSQ